MPRVSRFVTEFTTPDGKEWEAAFTHRHGREEGCGASRRIVEPILHTIESGPRAGRVVRVQHVTTVKLRHKGTPIFVRGTAACSLRDYYRWQKGIHYALQLALEKAGHCKLGKDAKGRVIVVERSGAYNDVVEAFWHEVQVAQHNRLGLPERTPPQNRNGTYHTGAD